MTDQSRPAMASDEQAARDAMVAGWNACKYTNSIGKLGKLCDCDLGAVDGCKARVEAIAAAIAKARGDSQ
jgi:hypothetical protein